MIEKIPFTAAVSSRGSGSKGLPQSEWISDGQYPVIGQGAKFVEGRSDREDLLLNPDPAVVLYGGHTRRAKLVTEPFVPGPNVKILTPGPRVEAAFLYRFLEQLKIESRGYADHFPEVKRSSIPVPPLAQQKRIAGILDAADALRAKRRESLAQLDTLLQSTFLEMFGDPVTNPMGWEVLPLKDLLAEKSINGAYYPKEAYSDSGTPMVHMANAFNGVVDLRGIKRVDAPLSDVAKYGLQSSDVLISRRSLVYEGSAKPCLIPDTNEPLIFESSLIRVRPEQKKVLTIYLFHFLQNDRARGKYVFPFVTRSTISGINQSNLMKVNVVVPSLDLQRRFAGIVESIEQQKASQRAHLEELDTLFASLQSRAFNGDL